MSDCQHPTESLLLGNYSSNQTAWTVECLRCHCYVTIKEGR
jgi:hypothetical protein